MVLTFGELALDLAPLFDDPQPNDTRFVFSNLEPSSELWANSKILCQASTYFKDLLTRSGFRESARARVRTQAPLGTISEEERGEDSDEEWDAEHPPKTVDETKVAPMAFHEVFVTDAAYSTYRAVVVWIYTGQITFAPIQSSATPKRYPNSVSPKSVYRLAHFLDISDLKTLALAAFKQQVSSANAAVELFSETSRLYEEVQAVLLDFVVQQWSEVKNSDGMQEIERLLEAEEDVPMGATMLKIMLELAKRLAPPTPSRGVLVSAFT